MEIKESLMKMKEFLKEPEWYFFKIGVSVLAFSVLSGWGYSNFISPKINIWQQGMRGQAELAHAEYNRQIAICEAMAKKESAKALADAEVIRAEGVAKANKIIGESLNENESYLRYLWDTIFRKFGKYSCVYSN